MPQEKQHKFISPRHKQRCKGIKSPTGGHYTNRPRQFWNRMFKTKLNKLRVA